MSDIYMIQMHVGGCLSLKFMFIILLLKECLCICLVKNFVTWDETEKLTRVVTDERLKKSMFTEWFVAKENSDEGHDLAYCEFPNRFTWIDKDIY